MHYLTKVTAIICAAFCPMFPGFTTFAQLIPQNEALADNGTNLWLSISLSNNVVALFLHNTQPGTTYSIRSREDLAGGEWFSEGTVTGANATVTTPTTINIGDRTNSLFLQAIAWTTNNPFTTAPMLAVGGERIMALTTNGDVVSWGGNQCGQLGDYTFLDSSQAVHVVGLTQVAKIASGMNHSLALDSQGTLWAWGQNSQGQLGDDGYEYRANLPVPVTGMTNIIALAAHGNFAGSDGEYGYSVAVKTDGTVWMWGNEYGGYSFGMSPMQITGISNVTGVAVGALHALALKADGTVWAWGVDSRGQLGDGFAGDTDTPIQVTGLSNIVAICAGDYHSLALETNGRVWAWGNDYLGVIGNGGGEADHPVVVFANAVQIAAGAYHSLAVDNERQLWAWGADEAGELGDGAFNNAYFPVQIVGMTNIVVIAAGSHASVALDADGNIWQWGTSGANGQFWAWGDEAGLPMQPQPYDDFYRGELPKLEILSGNHQLRHAGSEFVEPLVFQVSEDQGMALRDAPVSVEVTAGDMELRTVRGGDNYSGLRLTTDADGKVSLIGYVPEYASDPDCLVRVLAAVRERLVEVDFNETIVARPSLSIIEPVEGGTYLVRPDQSLAISVDTQAAPGASVQEVDFNCRLDGEDTSLGISTQSPFSLIWTNVLWWTNAFIGQYTLSAAALDDAGGWSDAQSVNFTVALDSDGNGTPDDWQLRYFGHLGVDPDADPDGDGIRNLEEYQSGISPTDYYNGALPNLEIWGGNDQSGNYDSFLPCPVVIRVFKIDPYVRRHVLANAPVVFSVTNGTALLATTTNDALASSIAIRTDTNGQALVWVYFPPAGAGPPDSTILVTASSGNNSAAVIVNEFIPQARWRFNDPETWAGEAGQLPLFTNNLTEVPSWSSHAVLVDNNSPAWIAYRVVETNGRTNLNCQTGSVRFWFKPDWNSTNAGGDGPGSWGRLMEIGSHDPAFANGWWALYLSPDGTHLLFGTRTNGLGRTNLVGNISWHSNEWYQIALTYSPTGSALYVDGRWLAGGAGVMDFSNAGELTAGFRIGSDGEGNNQARGAFDELETFDYPLAAAHTATSSSELPDWWLIKYFNRTDLDPDLQTDRDGFTLWLDYQRGRDPNVISFFISATNLYVNTDSVPVQINIQYGMPSVMVSAVQTSDLAVTLDQPFDINSNFTDVTWQPYTSNVVASLNSGDGDYHVWVGLRGISPDGQQTWGQTRLVLDTTPPVLLVTNPAAGLASKPVIQLQGRANEILSSLTYDVSNATGVWTNQTGYVTGQYGDPDLLLITTNWFQCYNVSLAGGPNTITLHAADLAGNTTTLDVEVTLDASAGTNAPGLMPVWPQNGTYISGSNFTLRAQVDDPMLTVSACIVDAGGNTNVAQGVVEQSGLVWVQHLPLADGANSLTVTATDAMGNSSVTNLTLFKSSVIVTMNPLADDQLNQSSLNVGGTVSDPGCTVTVNDVTATVDPEGNWVAEYVPVNSSGTALFDVEVHSGSTLNPILANLRSTPMDASEAGNNGSQFFDRTLPVKVGLMTYSLHHALQFVNYAHMALQIWDFGTGQLVWGRYPNTFEFENYDDRLCWTFSGGPGSYGGFERGYDYFSGVSLAEGYYWRSGRSNVWANPLPAIEYNQPWENSSYSVPSSGGSIVSVEEFDIQTRVAIQPQGQIAAGTFVTYLVEAQAWDKNTGRQLASDLLQIQNVRLTPATKADGSVWGQMTLLAPAGAIVDVTPMAQGNYTFNVQACQLGPLLAVDNNRDGQISLDAGDATSPINPYRFWINDSREHGDDESEGGADDQIPGSSSPNHLSYHVQGRSDYVNFFPVVLCLSNTLQLLSPTNGYEYRLYQANDCVKLVYTDLQPSNAFEYLTNSTAPNNYVSIAGYSPSFSSDSSGAISLTTLDAADVVKMPSSFPSLLLNTNWLAQVWTNGGTGVILVEGRAETTHPLMLEIWHNGKILVGAPLYLSFSGVEQMFRHVNLSYVNGSVEVPPRADAPNEPQTIDKNFVFLHGYNVNQQQARGVLSEMFKRMYWSGSKAKFYGVTWNGAESQIRSFSFTPNYHTNVVNALQTAQYLAVFLTTYPGKRL